MYKDRIWICKRRKKLLPVCLMVCAASVVSYAEGQESTCFDGIFQAAVSTLSVEENLFYEYPVLTGVDGFDENIVNEINQYFYNSASQSLTEQEIEMNSMKEDLMEYDPEAADHMSYEVTCDNIYINGTVYSVKQDSYAYLGGAHGYAYSFGTSFDLSTGEEMTMGELLGCDEEIAREAVVAAYREHVIGQVENITEEDIRNSFDSMEYWLEEDGLHVDIAAYVIASYAAGPQHAVVTPEIMSRVYSYMPYEESIIDTGQAPENAVIEEMITVIQGIQAPASDFVIPGSSSKVLTMDDLHVLKGNSAEEDHYRSQLAINEILARYGYQFNPEQGGAAREAYDQFEGKTWYEQAKQYCPSASASEMLYTHISDLELSNIDLICEWQKIHGCYY